MEWLEVTVKTVSPAIDLLGDKLTAMGYDSFIIDDSEDFKTFLEDNTQYWDYVDEELAEKMDSVSQIRLYIENDSVAPEKLAILRSSLADWKAKNPGKNLGSLEVTLENLQEEDWENNWKQYYQPIPIGEKLIIVPEWIKLNDLEGRTPVMLDPGMIFGTGSHASTQMCLRALEKAVKGGERVVDLGSGSGILSIAALLLGADTATGVDIDPKAEDIARDNAALNNLTSPRFQAVTGNVIGDRAMMEKLSEGGYDIVLANIVADVIIPLSVVVPNFLREDALFICSGIINYRHDDVVAAIKQAGLTVIEEEMQDDWYRLTCKRK